MKHCRENVVTLCGVTDVHTVVVASGAVQGTGSRVRGAVVGREINNNPLASGSSEQKCGFSETRHTPVSLLRSSCINKTG